MPPDTVIKVSNLKKSYGTNRVLRGVSFGVPRGTMLALLGPNGAGKTTIVRILSTLLRPDGGQVRVEGHDVVSQTRAVQKVIGLTGQSAAVDEFLTGRENLVMMGRLYRLTKASSQARAQELLDEFDLAAQADKTVKTYSGGLRRRLDLAVSLIAKPPVIFLDEPTTGLDPRSRLVMWDIITQLLAQDTTILLTTQYLEEADQLANNIIVIDGGRIIAEGSPKALKAKIGRERLILTFKSSDDWEKARTCLGKKVNHTNPEDRQLTLFIEGDGRDLSVILDRLRQKKLAIDSMDIHKPTLDDVFLTLTKSSKDREGED